MNDSFVANAYRVNTAITRLNDARIIAVSDASADYSYIADVYAKYDGSTSSVPVVPSKVYSEQQGNEIVVTWEDNSSNEDGFKIYRSVGSSNSFSLIGTVGSNEVFFTDTSIIEAQTYYYKVAAMNEAYGLSPESMPFKIETHNTSGYPALPQVIPQDDILRYMNVSYLTAIQTENGVYKIPQCASSFAGTTFNRIINPGSASSLSLLVYARSMTSFQLEVKHDTDYLFSQSLLVDGTNAWQTIIFPFGCDESVSSIFNYIAFSNVSDEFYIAALWFDDAIVSISPPSVQGVMAGSSTVDIYMNSLDSNTVGYYIYRVACPEDQTIPLSSFSFDGARITTAPLTDTWYVDMGVQSGYRYYYGFTAVNEMGEESVYSDIYQVTPGASISPDVPILQDPGDYSHVATDLTLMWSDMSLSGARFYELEVRKGVDLFLREEVYGTSFTLSLTDEAAYFFKVRSLNDAEALGGAVSDWS
jgi:hypothetical protein